MENVERESAILSHMRGIDWDGIWKAVIRDLEPEFEAMPEARRSAAASAHRRVLI